MNPQTFVIRNDRIASNCAEAVLNSPKDGSVTVELRDTIRLRTGGQNRRFWATLTEHVRAVSEEVEAISKHTGYSVWEVKRIVAAQMEPEQIAILYAQSPEAVHEVLKAIHGIPTSTRLGTKKFMEYEESMERVLTEVVGTVRAVAREAT